MEKDNELKLAEKDVIKLQADIAGLNRELLHKESLFTSRGILEFMARRVAIQAGIKSSVPVTNILAETFRHQEVSVVAKTMVKCAVESGVPNTHDEVCEVLTSLYGELSKEIHGHAWNPKSIEIMGKHLSNQQQCIIKALCS